MSNKVIGNIILEGATTVEDTIITDGSTKRVIAEGTLQDMDKENRNRRIYAKADLEPEINGDRMKELINAKQFCGEYGHPLSDDLVRQQTIDPKLVCVRFLKVWTEGNLVKAQFKGTNNNYGEYFDQDLREGCLPAFSLRALGTIENVNGKAYVKGIKIITWDSVIYPSHKVAYTDRIVSESALDGKVLSENSIVVPENDPGTIIKITEGAAMDVINRLQRESANVTKIVETFDGIYDSVTLLNENTLLMTSRYGDKITVNLEKHVNNIIMDYAFKM
jgi:hypothetical protein